MRFRSLLPVLLIATVLPACRSTGAEAACVRDVTIKSCAGADLQGVELSGRDFSGWDFSGADLRGAQLAGGVFSGANFDRARLDDVLATGADFTQASFFAASAVRADLTATALGDADLEGTDLRAADLTGAAAPGIRLHEVNLVGTDLTGTDLTGALFARVFLGDTTLVNADLSDVVFTGTDLSGADLSGARFAGALLRGEDRVPTVEQLPGATVCRDHVCNISVSAPAPVYAAASSVAVSADAFTLGAYSAARFGASYGESPVAVSRGLALSYLAAFGLYPESSDREVLLWDPAAPGTEVSAGLRDVAALYALANTAIALRRSPQGDAFDGRMRGLMLARDVTLWELTRTAPEVRTTAVRLAVDASARVLARAATDGYTERSKEYTGTGDWARTPPAFVPALEPNWAKLTRFLAASNDCDAPAPVSDPRRAAQETRRLADAATEDPRAAARFWDDERVRTATPPGHWVFIAAEAMRSRVSSGSLSIPDAFQVMSELTVAMADSMSQVWEAKYLYRTARPITLLQEADPAWKSYLTNPPFPAYPSGHAAVSRAAANVLTRELGSFSFTSDGGTESAGANRVLNIEPRTFASFDAAATEAGLSRIWGGIHVQEDFVAAADIGTCVAALLD